MICDRIFGFWLRFVYREKLNSLTSDPQEQARRFCRLIEERIEQFISNNRKSVLERTIDLLRLFENESLQLHAKKIRLAQFKEVKPFNFSRCRLNQGLLGRSKDSLWIMAIKQDVLTEEDIIDFAAECQRLRYAKLEKKVAKPRCV